jgi:uncharacterized LabA/DUF88 family protein
MRKRTVAFVDGQSLFYAAKEAFGYTYPNFDVTLLCNRICKAQGWDLTQIRFYTGVPDAQDDNFWHNFWINKLTYMGQTGIVVFSRSLRYRNKIIKLPDDTHHTALVGQEKGIDVRIALDIIHLTNEKACDVCLIFSQDQDLSEVADEVRRIAAQHNRWIKIASAFPVSPTYENTRGINKTDWISIDKKSYDSCIDSKDYR